MLLECVMQVSTLSNWPWRGVQVIMLKYISSAFEVHVQAGAITLFPTLSDREPLSVTNGHGTLQLSAIAADPPDLCGCNCLHTTVATLLTPNTCQMWLVSDKLNENTEKFYQVESVLYRLWLIFTFNWETANAISVQLLECICTKIPQGMQVNVLELMIPVSWWNNPESDHHSINQANFSFCVT